MIYKNNTNKLSVKGKWVALDNRGGVKYSRDVKSFIGIVTEDGVKAGRDMNVESDGLINVYVNGSVSIGNYVVASGGGVFKAYATEPDDVMILGVALTGKRRNLVEVFVSLYKRLSMSMTSITGTKADFNAALTDGDFAYAADLQSYLLDTTDTFTGTLTVDGDVNATTFTGDLIGNADTATQSTKVTVTNVDAADAEYPVVHHNGSNTLYDTVTKLTFNPLHGRITASSFAGNLTGDVTGDLTGNADTATLADTATNATDAATAGIATTVDVNTINPVTNSDAPILFNYSDTVYEDASNFTYNTFYGRLKIKELYLSGKLETSEVTYTTASSSASPHLPSSEFKNITVNLTDSSTTVYIDLDDFETDYTDAGTTLYIRYYISNSSGYISNLYVRSGSNTNIVYRSSSTIVGMIALYYHPASGKWYIIVDDETSGVPGV